MKTVHSIRLASEALSRVLHGAALIVEGKDMQNAKFSLNTTRSRIAIDSDIGQVLIANRSELAFIGLSENGHAVHVARSSLPSGSLNW